MFTKPAAKAFGIKIKVYLDSKQEDEKNLCMWRVFGLIIKISGLSY